jgi:hypothetical protein
MSGRLLLGSIILTGLMLPIIIGFAYKVGVIDYIKDSMTYADMWAAGNVGNYRFYYAILHSNYAPLWSLFPLMLLLAVLRRPLLSVLCVSVFTAGFTGLSIAAWKAERYFSFLLPYFFIIIGIGLTSGLQFVYRYLKKQTAPLQCIFKKMTSEKIALLVIGIIFIFAMLGNYAFLKTTRLIFRDHQLHFPLMGPRDGALSWSRSVAVLKPIVDSVQVVVSSYDLKTLHYLGKVDYAVSPTHLYTVEGPLPEFTFDKKVGVSRISTAESMQKIINCHRSGLFIVQRMSTRDIPDSRAEVTYVAAAMGQEISLPEKWGLMAYRWETSAEDIDKDCRQREGKIITAKSLQAVR